MDEQEQGRPTPDAGLVEVTERREAAAQMQRLKRSAYRLVASVVGAALACTAVAVSAVLQGWTALTIVLALVTVLALAAMVVSAVLLVQRR